MRITPRVLAVFLLAIVGPTLVLLYLGLSTVRRQHEAIVSLERVTSRLTAEKIVLAMEAKAAALAEACLQDARVARAVQGEGDLSHPENAQRVRRSLDAACRAHPVCLDLVLVADGQGVPRLHEPLPFADDASPGRAADALEALRDGERHAAADHRALALAAYRRALVDSAPAQARAVALSRLGDLQFDAGEHSAAMATWDILRRDYGDTYDRAHRPQGLVAALQLQRAAAALPAREQAHIAALVGAAGRDLLEGRWIVSPAQAEYFRERLGADHTAARPGGRLFRQFDFARGIRSHLDEAGTPGAGTSRPFTVPSRLTGSAPVQAFATSLATSDGPAVVAVSLDLDWVRSELVPHLSRSVGAREPARVVPLAHGAVGFREVFPFWALDTSGLASSTRGPMAQSLAFGGAIAGVLAVLVTGVTLLVRDASREAATARVRSDLMNGVSHELRTPLSVIRLYAESLASEFPDGDPRAAQSQVILHESQRLGHLVERVLEFSRADRRATVVAPELHDPARLVREFARRYGPYLDHLGFAVVVEVASDVPDILVDAGALTQALVNLVDNAVKYADASPRVCLRVALATPSMVAIDVEDEGPGIAAEDRPRVLEAYYRGEHGGDPRGHGLGLHLVAAIMLAHGGDIEVGIATGGGTRVRLLFPARPGEDGD